MGACRVQCLFSRERTVAVTSESPEMNSGAAECVAEVLMELLLILES